MGGDRQGDTEVGGMYHVLSPHPPLDFALLIDLETSLSRSWVELFGSIKAGQSARSECQKEQFVDVWIF